ncbi:MAG: HAD-IA family hydrolase, partial [Gammaproteobacteria bacterium]
APDMVGALNLLMREQHREPLPFEQARNHVSKGGLALVQLGFADEKDEQMLETLRLRFLDIYSENLCIGTRLFAGMPEVLDFIDARGMNWGVVTNKPAWLTEPLMEALGLHERAACVISGDTLEKRKPHPEPLLHACELAASPAGECVFIGDDARDIEAGKAAQMATLVALYGYIDDDSFPAQWGADGVIEQAADLIALLARISHHGAR